MYVVTNSVQPTQVEDKGGHYLIKNVPIVKPMNLAGGYVPRESIKETANEWAGTVPTLNHPRDRNGKPIAANQKPELHLGEVVTSQFDGEYVRSNIKLNKTDLKRLDEAKAIEDALANGDPINVSSQYKAESLPPGEYDGEYRENVEQIVEPDSVAILPNKRGVCDIAAGCGINPEMVANSDLSIPMTDDPQGEDSGMLTGMQANQLSEARTPTFEGTTTGEWSKPDFNEYVEAFGYDEVSEVSDLTDEQAQQIAETTLLGDPDAETFDSLQFFPVVEPDSMNLSENALMAVLSGRGAQADISEDTLASARTVARELLEDEFNRDMTDNSAFSRVLRGLRAAFGMDEAQTANEGAESSVETETTMSDKTADLVANHGFDAENLPEEDTDCFSKIYDAVTANDGDGSTESDDPADAPEEVVMTENELEDLIEEKAEAIVANREEQTEKERLVDEIVANSAEYSEDDEETLLDTPTRVLKRLAEDTNTKTPTMPGHGVSANTTPSDDYGDFPSPIASERAKELED